MQRGEIGGMSGAIWEKCGTDEMGRRIFLPQCTFELHVQYRNPLQPLTAAEVSTYTKTSAPNLQKHVDSGKAGSTLWAPTRLVARSPRVMLVDRAATQPLFDDTNCPKKAFQD